MDASHSNSVYRINRLFCANSRGTQHWELNPFSLHMTAWDSDGNLVLNRLPCRKALGHGRSGTQAVEHFNPPAYILLRFVLHEANAKI